MARLKPIRKLFKLTGILVPTPSRVPPTLPFLFGSSTQAYILNLYPRPIFISHSFLPLPSREDPRYSPLPLFISCANFIRTPWQQSIAQTISKDYQGPVNHFTCAGGREQSTKLSASQGSLQLLYEQGNKAD